MTTIAVEWRLQLAAVAKVGVNESNGGTVVVGDSKNDERWLNQSNG